MPRVGETIITTVDVLEDIFGMTLAEATVVSGNETLVRSQIKIAVKE